MRNVAIVLVLSVLAGCASSLKITSSPPGARILIDGKDTGYKTPDSVRPRLLPNGLHQISVAKEGYSTEAQALEVHVSGALVFWSMVFPPALLVNLFKGFSSANPGKLHFSMASTQQSLPASHANSRMMPAAPPQPAEAPRKKVTQVVACAALPLKTMALSAGLETVVDDVLLSELLHSGFDPIGRDDLNAILDFDKQKDAVDCNDSTCIAEIGQALGVPYLVSGNVVRLEDSSVITLKLLNVHETRVVARVNRVAPTSAEDVLLKMIGQAVQELAEKSGL